MKNKIKSDENGFSLLELTIGVSVSLALVGAGGYFTFDTINDNNNKKTIQTASGTGYAAALSAITDFDEDSNVESTLSGMNIDGITYTSTGDTKETLCVIASKNNGKGGVYESESGACDEESTPPPTAPDLGIQDTITSLTYQCDKDTTSHLPFKLIERGNATVKGSDGTAISVENVPHTISSTSSLPESGDVTFKAGVTYDVAFDGKYQRLNGEFGNNTVRDCLTSVNNIPEDSEITRISYLGGKKLIDVPESIPASVKDLQTAFYQATKFNDPDIKKWDISNVTNLSNAFDQAEAFNQNINGWNVSNVHSLNNLFYSAKSFNQPLNEWDTAKVTSMIGTFNGASSFNKNIDSWDVGKVSTLRETFKDTSSFNQPLDNWKTHNVTSMTSTFRNAENFNQDISDWKTLKVESMASMFQKATVFNADISGWDTSKVTHMDTMFRGASSFNQPIGEWTIENLHWYQAQIFYDATNFNQDLSNWDMTGVKDLSNMFNSALSFNQNLNKWNVDAAHTWGGVFYKTSMTDLNKPSKFR